MAGVSVGDIGHVAAHNNRGLDVTLPPYNAAGDGVTDDTGAFRDALGDLDAHEVLFLPPGATFLLSEVGITKPVTILGYGASIVGDEHFRPAADRVRILGVTFSGDKVLQGNTSDLQSRWLFRDCRFDGSTLRLTRPGRDDGSGQTLTEGSGLASHVQVVDCEFWGYEGNYTLEIAGLDYVTVRGCDFHDLGADVDSGDAIKVLHGANRVLIDGCTIVDPTRDCIDTYNGGRVTIRGCTLIGAGAAALDAKWLSAGTTETGLLILEGNRAEKCAAGFNCNVNRALIVGNICEDSDTYGFRAAQSIDGTPTATEYVSFVGNIAVGNGSYGFGFANGDNFILSGNQSLNNGTYGYTKGVSVGVLGDDTNNVADGNTSGGFSGFA